MIAHAPFYWLLIFLIWLCWVFIGSEFFFLSNQIKALWSLEAHGKLQIENMSNRLANHSVEATAACRDMKSLTTTMLSLSASSSFSFSLYWIEFFLVPHEVWFCISENALQCLYSLGTPGVFWASCCARLFYRSLYLSAGSVMIWHHWAGRSKGLTQGPSSGCWSWGLNCWPPDQ